MMGVQAKGGLRMAGTTHSRGGSGLQIAEGPVEAGASAGEWLRKPSRGAKATTSDRGAATSPGPHGV